MSLAPLAEVVPAIVAATNLGGTQFSSLDWRGLL